MFSQRKAFMSIQRLKLTGAARSILRDVKPLQAAPVSLSRWLSLSIIWAASIGRRYHGKEIDIQEADETQSSESQNGDRSGSGPNRDSGGRSPTTEGAGQRGCACVQRQARRR